jgi:predicted dehydrogenase
VSLLPDDWNAAIRPVFPETAPDYGIAVVGAGAIVNAAHLPAYRQAGLSVVGIYDVDRARAEATRARFNLPRVYPDLAQLLADPDVRIVDIAVPSEHQAGILKPALEAGKHVLCQKPLAPTWPAALETLRLVRRSPQSKVAVNQQMRWTPAIQSMAHVLRAGMLGEPSHASIQVSVHTDWNQWPWLLQEPHLLSLYNTIHLIDSFRYLFGTPEGVWARAGRAEGQAARGETQLFLALDYPGDFIGFIHDNHNNRSPERYAAVRCEGSRGTAWGTVGIWDNYPVGSPDRFGFWSEDNPTYGYQPTIQGRWAPDAFQGPMADLISAIAGDFRPMASVEDNLETLAMVHAAILSSQERRSVSLAEFAWS